MEYSRSLGLLMLLLIPAGLFAQEAADVESLHWGWVVVRPDANVLGAYDNRVLFDETTEDASSDFYTEVAGGVSLNNLPARYNLSARAQYGYRFHSDNIDLNDDFYTVGGAVGTDQNPFKWGLSANMDKSLNYNTFYNPSTGEGPDSILTDGPNRRSIARGNMAYEKQLSEKTSIMPNYDAQHYYQEFQDFGTAEWQIHSVGIELRREHSAKTRFTVGGGYSLQVNDDEEGYIGMVEVGVESSMSDKISWRVSLGFSAAEYELSGSDQGGISNFRGVWQATEKVSAYIFGGNDYQPGYDGAARIVYRAGYGANWQLATRWTLSGSVLHDYQDSLGSDKASPGVGEVRHFFNANTGYKISKRFLLSLNGSYVNDEYAKNQTVASLGLNYSY